MCREIVNRDITKRWTEAETAARNSRDVASPHCFPLKHFEPIGGSVNVTVMPVSPHLFALRNDHMHRINRRYRCDAR